LQKERMLFKKIFNFFTLPSVEDIKRIIFLCVKENPKLESLLEIWRKRLAFYSTCLLIGLGRDRVRCRLSWSRYYSVIVE
jgi:hypothetical protein